ncbi:hypothetical protein [Victivallis lenta]|uniref:hypothetical protein n=1 Tax=Victivallis lenta TaxID=2606640 RepID=UPI003AB4E9B5
MAARSVFLGRGAAELREVRIRRYDADYRSTARLVVTAEFGYPAHELPVRYEICCYPGAPGAQGVRPGAFPVPHGKSCTGFLCRCLDGGAYLTLFREAEADEETCAPAGLPRGEWGAAVGRGGVPHFAGGRCQRAAPGVVRLFPPALNREPRSAGWAALGGLLCGENSLKY